MKEITDLALAFHKASEKAITASEAETKLAAEFDELFASNPDEAERYVRYDVVFGIRMLVRYPEPDGTGRKYVDALYKLNKASLVRAAAWTERNKLEDEQNRRP
jgi:hypothetical protein